MQDDRNIILYATKDEQAEKELREKFKPQDTNVKLVAMDSKAVDDYLKQVEKQERKDVSAKLTQARWRQTAFNEAMRLEALRRDIENKLQDVRDDLVEYKRLLDKDETDSYSTQEQELTK